jgi:acyl carrier protein
MLDTRLVQTVSRLFQIQPSSVTPETSPDNLAAWDSVGHLNLILELEDVFGIRFPSDEIPMVNTVARLQEAISRLTVGS